MIMTSLPNIYLIHTTDAPLHLSKLKEILNNLKSQNRIGGIISLDAENDLSGLTNKITDGELVITLLTTQLEPQQDRIEAALRNLIAKKPNIRIAEVIVDNLTYDNEYITFPSDLRPIRSREDMDAVWISIEQSLKDMFPANSSPVQDNRLKYIKIAGAMIAVIIVFFIIREVLDDGNGRAIGEVTNGPIVEDEEEANNGSEGTDEPAGSETPPLAGEDCLSFNPQNIQTRQEGSQFLLTDGSSRMMVFRTREKADQAVSIIQHYLFENHCFAVRPNPGLKYLTVQGDIPSGDFPGEDCIRINDPQNLTIRNTSPTLFQVLDGNHIPFSAKSREEAERIIEVVKHYNARFTCFVERPNPGMVYLKK